MYNLFTILYIYNFERDVALYLMGIVASILITNTVSVESLIAFEWDWTPQVRLIESFTYVKGYYVRCLWSLRNLYACIVPEPIASCNRISVHVGLVALKMASDHCLLLNVLLGMHLMHSAVYSCLTTFHLILSVN